MSITDFRSALQLAAEGHSVETLLMAAIRVAGVEQRAQLREAFPRLWNEFDGLDHAPAGLLPGEGLDAPPRCTAEMRVNAAAALECQLQAGHPSMHRHGERTFWVLAGGA